jgi:hypothetical protein
MKRSRERPAPSVVVENADESPVQDCPCPKLKCEFHGRCAACRARHYAKNGLPFCERNSRR